MKIVVAAVAACLMLAGCASTCTPNVRTQTVKVKVPVYKKPTPPDWLMQPPLTSAQVGQIFVAPDADGVVLGVTRGGLKQFYLLLDSSVTRIEAWRAWADTDTTDGEPK